MKRICNWIHPFWDTILVICRRSFLFSCGFWVNARQRWLRWYRRTYSEGNPKSYSKRHGETMPIWRCDNAIIALLSCLEVWMIHFVHRMLSIHRRKEGRFYFLLFILSVPNIFSFSSSPELLQKRPVHARKKEFENLWKRNFVREKNANCCPWNINDSRTTLIKRTMSWKTPTECSEIDYFRSKRPEKKVLTPN